MITGNAYPGGFQINEHGARAMGMSGAFTGLANDASAVYFNPAGITQLSGTHFMGGATLIAPTNKFDGPTPLTTEWDMKSQTFFPFNFYATRQLNENVFIGLGVNNPFGLGTKWDDNWVGNELAIDTEVKTYFITPVIAYKFNDMFSISAGPRFAIADVKIVRAANAGAGEFQTEMNGNTTAWGFAVGALFRPSKQFQVGVNYQSEVKFDFEGTATSTPKGFNHPLLGVFIPYPNGDITAPLTTPQNITAGIAVMPNECWTITADYQYIGWSSYDKLEVDFKNYNSTNPLAPGGSVQSVNRNYQNTYILRAGAEYKASDVLALRGGVLYDHNPVEDAYVEPTLPDADRVGINVGLGYKLSDKLSVDIAYLLLLFNDRTITNSNFGLNGTYKASASLVGLDFSYSL